MGPTTCLDEDSFDGGRGGDDAQLDYEVAQLVAGPLGLDLQPLLVELFQLEEEEVEQGVAGEGQPLALGLLGLEGGSPWRRGGLRRGLEDGEDCGRVLTVEDISNRAINTN